MGGEGQILKRIPRIKFPQRHPKSSASGQSQIENSVNKDVNHVSFSSSDVRQLPRNTSVGGKATLQPKRTPLSDEEIEAILAGLRSSKFLAALISFILIITYYMLCICHPNN